MISNGSLSAFSSLNAGTSAIGGRSPASPVQQVRSTSQASDKSSTSGSTKALPAPVEPGRILPRGSLLNLAV